MITKVGLLTALKDWLTAHVSAVNGRVAIVVQDAQGNADLPVELAPPFLTVADAGWVFEWHPGGAGHAVAAVRVRAYVQDLRGAESQVIGHAASGSAGAATIQDTLVQPAADGGLHENLLDYTGLEEARVTAAPPVNLFQGESWTAVTGDVLITYEGSASSA